MRLKNDKYDVANTIIWYPLLGAPDDIEFGTKPSHFTITVIAT